MKNFSYLIIFITFLTSSINNSFSQNLIPNHSFEDGSKDWDGVYTPEIWYFVSNTFAFEKSPLAPSCTVDILNDGCDDFCDTSFRASTDIPINYFGDIVPSHSNHCVGIIHFVAKDCGESYGSSGQSGSLIGVQLKSTLIKGNKYAIQFKASKMDNSTKDPKYEVLFAKGIYENNVPYDKIKVYDSKITSTADWQQVYFEFIPEEDGLQYFFIRTDNNLLPKIVNLVGMYIDDVQVYDKCLYDFPCSRTAGIINPTSNHSVNGLTDGWLKIDGLDNVSKAIVTISALTGGEVLYSRVVECPNGIKEPIYWDGRTTTGSFVAEGNYNCKLQLINDCWNKEFSFGFVVNYLQLHPEIAPVYSCNTNPIRVPKPCCAKETDIFINNASYTSPGNFDYLLLNKIVAGPNVKVNHMAEVSYTAGNIIELLPGFEANQGSVFSAVIQPCSPEQITESHTSVKAPISINESINEANSSTSAETFLPISIFPNPTSGTFSIKHAGESAFVQISDLTGKILLSSNISTGETSIDISPFDKGIYFIKVMDKTEIKILKIIHQ